MSENLNSAVVGFSKQNIKNRKKRKINEKYLIVLVAIVLFFVTFFIYGVFEDETTENNNVAFSSENRDIRAQIIEMEKRRKLVLEKEKKIEDDIFMGKGVSVSDIANDIMSGIKDLDSVKHSDEKDIFFDFRSEYEDKYSGDKDEDPFSDFNPDHLNTSRIDSDYSGSIGNGNTLNMNRAKSRGRSIKAYSNLDRTARIFNNGNEIIVNYMSKDIENKKAGQLKLKSSLIKKKASKSLIYNDNPVKKIFEGDFLDAVLMNRVVNDISESPVICRVVKDFYDSSGTFVLVPFNTKIIGKAMPVSGRQGNKLRLKFHRMIFPNNRSVSLDRGKEMSALNLEGTSGLKGGVNNHFLKKYGSSLFYGFLSGLGGFAQNRLKQSSGASMMIGRSSESFEQLNNRIAEKSMSIVPTISLNAGSPLKIYISEDIKISAYSKIDEREYFKNDH